MNTDIIRERKSVRTYQQREIAPQLLEKIQRFLKQDTGLFGAPVTFYVLDADRDGLSSPVIVGARTYIAGKYKVQKNAEISFGYAFEKLILYATSLGLGTVWLAATMDRKAFEKAVCLKEEERMPAVTPLGYAADKRSLRETMMRKGMKSDSRMPFEKLFFKNDFSTPLLEEEAGIWKLPLSMVRLAPSATNKQPWRCIIEHDRVHFYEVKTKGYANETAGDIQKVDLGIAMCHFETGAEEEGIHGTFLQQDPKIPCDAGTEYIATYVREN